jgi:hypothetical protein
MSALAQKQTCAVQESMFVVPQKRTHAAQQKGSLFDHFVDDREQPRSKSEPERTGGFEVKDQFELG